MKTKITIVAVLVFCCLRHIYAQDNFKVRTAPLRVTHRSTAFKKILSEPINDIVVSPKFAVFKSNRKLWVKFPDSDVMPLSELVALPSNFDWYEAVCIVGNQLIASVGNYSEEQRQKERNEPEGAFIAGSSAVGLLIVDLELRQYKLMEAARIIARPPKTYDDPYEKKSLVPSFQSAHYDGKELYLGAYGLLYKLSLDTAEASIIEEEELEDNRPWIFKEGETIWAAADSGGDGASVRKSRDGRSKDYFLLNTDEISPDRVIRFGKRLLTSSSAGIIEIDERAKTYVHYQFSRDKEKMGVYKLSVLNGSLWGVRPDGIARFDMRRNSAIHYRMRDGDKPVEVLALGVFDGKWYAGTKNGLVIIDTAAF
jgi:hypothetical protein